MKMKSRLLLKCVLLKELAQYSKKNKHFFLLKLKYENMKQNLFQVMRMNFE